MAQVPYRYRTQRERKHRYALCFDCHFFTEFTLAFNSGSTKTDINAINTRHKFDRKTKTRIITKKVDYGTATVKLGSIDRSQFHRQFYDSVRLSIRGSRAISFVRTYAINFASTKRSFDRNQMQITALAESWIENVVALDNTHVWMPTAGPCICLIWSLDRIFFFVFIFCLFRINKHEIWDIQPNGDGRRKRLPRSPCLTIMPSEFRAFQVVSLKSNQLN